MYEVYDRQKDDVIATARTKSGIQGFVKKYFYDKYAPESMAYAEDELVIYQTGKSGRVINKYTVWFKGSRPTLHKMK